MMIRCTYDIYTKLQFEKSDSVGVVMTHKRNEILNSIEYEKTFLIKSGEGKFVKLILCGNGGGGKSMFFVKIAYVWAVGSSHMYSTRTNLYLF